MLLKQLYRQLNASEISINSYDFNHSISWLGLYGYYNRFHKTKNKTLIQVLSRLFTAGFNQQSNTVLTKFIHFKDIIRSSLNPTSFQFEQIWFIKPTERTDPGDRVQQGARTQINVCICILCFGQNKAFGLKWWISGLCSDNEEQSNIRFLYCII